MHDPANWFLTCLVFGVAAAFIYIAFTGGITLHCYHEWKEVACAH